MIKSEVKLLLARIKELDIQIDGIRTLYQNNKNILDEKKRELLRNHLDKHLLDSKGKTIKKGMLISKDGRKYEVKDRYEYFSKECLEYPRIKIQNIKSKSTKLVYSPATQFYTIK